MNIDYSDRAVTMRIRQVSQIRKLCLSLAKARPVTPSRNLKNLKTAEREADRSA